MKPIYRTVWRTLASAEVFAFLNWLLVISNEFLISRASGIVRK